MTSLISLHAAVFDSLERHASWLVPTLARLVFAAIFLIYFWNSAGLKFEGSIFSASAGAFGQIFPKAAEAVLWDVSQLSIFQRIVIFLGTVAEYALPALIIAGLLTRLAAVGMIGFVIVQTFVDVTGHGVTLGAFFDNTISLLDQRTLWVFLLFILAARGAGPVSVDWLVGRMMPNRAVTA